MKLKSKLTIWSIATAVLTGFAVSCNDDDDPKPVVNEEVKYFATTDMSLAEFYAGELEQTTSALSASGYDAVTCATRKKASSFSAFDIEDSCIIKGMKEVGVGMTESVYNALSDADKKRFTFVDAALPVYKQLNADGSFGKLNNKSVSFKASNVTLSTGFDARFDQYLIKIDDVDFSSLKDTTNKLAYLWGGVITTTDGSKYGMIPLNNLWLNSAEFGFSISEFKEAHGYDVRYQHTTDLEGKTIKNVTYLAKDKENISVDLNVYVKNSTNATVVANTPKAGADVTVDLTFSNIPSDANYKVSAVKSGSGKAAKALTEEQYSYSDGKLVLKGEVAAGTYTISFADDKYVNIGTAITVE